MNQCEDMLAWSRTMICMLSRLLSLISAPNLTPLDFAKFYGNIRLNRLDKLRIPLSAIARSSIAISPVKPCDDREVSRFSFTPV